MRILKSTLLAGAALLAMSQSALAQPTSAGGQLQQIPPPPTLQRAEPETLVERRAAPPPAEMGGAKTLVRTLRITGQTVAPEADLIGAAGFQPNTELSLAELRAMAARISAYYNQRGYFVAQAYLPPQEVQDGVVTIAVIEGRYGVVELRNQSRVSDGLAKGILNGLSGGDAVMAAPLERRLMLLSDLPGVTARSTLSPGASVGASDLIVELSPRRRVTGSLEADNAGNRYTGAARLGGTVNLNEPLGIGDVASLRVLGSTTGGLAYVRGSYQAQIRALTLGAAYSAIRYELGKEFSPLKAKGTANIASLYAAYPVVRSRNDNLYVTLGGDAKTFRDEVRITGTVANKRAQTLTAGVNGDHRDGFGGGGWTAYALSGTVGDLDLRTPQVRAIDALTARTNGGYKKLSFSAARLQTVTDALSIYASARGQIASKNLDISEKMELGGAYAVRAYPEGEGYGDQGYVATVEPRLRLPQFSERQPGQIELFGFVDHGEVRLAKTPWATGSKHATRSGGGVGASWSDPGNFVVRATYAHKIGSQAATSAPDSSGRFWVQLAKTF